MPSKPPKEPNRIKELRSRAGLSQDDLAKKVGTSRQQIARLEDGDRRLTVGWMQRVAKALGVEPSDLIATAAVAELVPDVEPIHSERLDDHIRLLVSRGLGFYRVIRDTCIRVGIAAGATISVDQTEQAIARVVTGDVVIVRMTDASRPKSAPVLGLRQFVAPSLLITNRPGQNLSVDMQSQDLCLLIVGVVIRDAQREGAIPA